MPITLRGQVAVADPHAYPPFCAPVFAYRVAIIAAQNRVIGSRSRWPTASREAWLVSGAAEMVRQLAGAHVDAEVTGALLDVADGLWPSAMTASSGRSVLLRCSHVGPKVV